MVDWRQLVEERNVWVAYNFPTVDLAPGEVHIPIQSVQGVIEELGELSHAHLKQAQNIRGSADKHVADGKDAIGDMMVYLMGVMNFTKEIPVNSRPFVQSESADSALLQLAVVVGGLSLRVDRFPKARYFIGDSMSRVAQMAAHYCEHRGWDFDGIVNETWAGVKQRDWIKYPDTGLPAPEESPLPPQAVWDCVVGEFNRAMLPPGADLPMRTAVEKAYKKLTGRDSNFIFSGWGGRLTPLQRQIVDEDQ